MTTGGPTTWFSGKSAPEDQKGPSPLLFLGTAFLLYSPIGAAVVVACYIAFNYYRVSHRVIAGLAALYTIPFIIFYAVFSSTEKMFLNYNAPIKRLVLAIKDKNMDGFLGDNWWFWFAHQFWLSLALGLIVGAAWTSWKWIRRPAWEDNERVPGPIHRLRRRKLIKSIQSDTTNTPDGATLGVDRFGTVVVQSQAEAAAHTLLAGGAGSGKALDVDTPIATTDGWKRMGDVTVGDLVFDETGQPTAVVGAFDVQTDRPCYEVVFSDGSTVVADAEHLWYTETLSSRKSRNRNRNTVRDRSVAGTVEERTIASLALQTARADDRVSIRSIGETLGWEPSRYGALHRWLNQTVPVGTEYAPAYVAVHGTQKVQRNSGAPTAMFGAQEAWSVVAERLNAVLNDQSAHQVSGSVRTTEEIKSTLIAYNGKTEHSVPIITAPVAYPEVTLPFDPYLLGLWLGDGATSGARFTTADPELLDAWIDAGYNVKPVKGTKYDYSISGGLHTTLGTLGVRGNKNVPSLYLRASESARRALLAGLMDTDGTHSTGPGVSFTNKNRNLADAVHELAASLGYRPTMRSRYSTLNGVKHGPYWVVAFAAATNTDIFRLERKRVSHAIGRATACISRHEQRMIVDVRPVSSRPVRCIKVAAPSSLFLAGKSFIPTHNTTTLMAGIRDQIRRGEPVCFVDLKGSTDVPAKLAEWSERYGRRFLHWSITDRRIGYQGPADGPAFYDPIGRGDPSRKKDLLIGSEKWDVEYYKSVNENYLQTAFKIAELVPNPQVDAFTDLAALLDTDKLKARATALFLNSPKTAEGQQHGSANGVQSRWWEHYPTVLDPYVLDVLSAAADILIKPEESERSAIRNMAARVQKLRQSTAGAWLKRDPEHGRDIDLRKVADEGWVVVFSLDSSNYKATSQQVGGLIIQDLNTMSGELRANPSPHPFHIYVDEFSAIGSDNIIDLLARARDARMPTILSTQALADLTKADPAFLDQALGIVNSFIIHRANTEADAEIFAGLTGKRMKYKKTYGVEMTSGMPGGMGTGAATGDGRIEQVEDYVVLPSEFQSLKQGQMVYIAKSPNARVVYPVDVIREDPDQVAHAFATGAATPSTYVPVREQTSPFSETAPDTEEPFPSPWPVMAQDVTDEVDPVFGDDQPYAPAKTTTPAVSDDKPRFVAPIDIMQGFDDAESVPTVETPRTTKPAAPRVVIDPAAFRDDIPTVRLQQPAQQLNPQATPQTGQQPVQSPSAQVTQPLPATEPTVPPVAPPVTPAVVEPEPSTSEESVFGGGDIEWEADAPSWDQAEPGLPVRPPANAAARRGSRPSE